MVKLILNIYCILSLLLLSKQSIGMEIDTPVIVVGKSKITGKIISPNETNKNNIFVNITVSNPISGEFVKYKTLADQSGKFSMDVDVETSISFITLNTNLNAEKYLFVKLTNGDVTNVDIAYNSDGDIENINVTPMMNQYDITQGFEVMNKMIDYRSGRAREPLYNKSTDYFLNYVKSILSERLEILNENTFISKELKGILFKDIRLFLYNAHVFDYEKYMMFNYRNTNGDQNKKPDIQKIDRSYYRFLKDFNLNDPQYLNSFTFSEVQKEILQNDYLKIPEIGENDIPSWLTRVKVLLSDLIGFKHGQYYDILAANAYARQLNEELKPLTEKQKKNIVSYWKQGEIAKILFRKNQQVTELDKFKSPAIVNEISSISNDNVIETIISKYKNKVVFIDLWATWCAPCLDAMKHFRDTKNGFKDKDVTFIYITNASSPRKLWEEKIKGIGDQHYYLTNAQWQYIMNHFGFDAIPSYLLYNKEGVLINKFTAFPGNEKVKEMINGLL